MFRQFLPKSVLLSSTLHKGRVLRSITHNVHVSSRMTASTLSTLSGPVTGSQYQRQERGGRRAEVDWQSRAVFWLTLAMTASTIMSSTSSSTSTAHCEECKCGKKKTYPVISRKEVEKHTSADKGGIWVTYLDGVYDVTQFIQNHPGGKEKLLSVAGQDISGQWGLYAHHKTSPLVMELLQDMKIGTLPAEDVIIPAKVEHKRQYSNEPLYDVIIIGSGLSGLQCGWSLVEEHHIAPEKILVLEAQDYIGGRVKQIHEFVKGTKIEVGAEFLHGNGTELTKFAKKQKEPLREIFCWAHGDGGPLDHSVDGGYGLYYVGKADLNAPNTYRLPKPYKDDQKQQQLNKKDRLLRYDDKDPDFVALNEALWELTELDENKYDDKVSLYDYLLEKKLNMNMLKMAEGGFANTLCANSEELSLKQAIKWTRIWHNEEAPEGEEDGDYTFKNSYSCLVDFLKKKLQVELYSAVQTIEYDPEDLSKNNIVKLTTKDGVEYKAKNIVVTASPHVINEKLIQFQPPLPEEISEAYSWVKMNSITKVIMKFEKPAWPKDLHGMIMTDDSFLLPEVWFRNVEDEVAPDEKATAYAVGFTTAKYTERLNQYTQEEVLQKCVKQLDHIFSQLEPRHMSADPKDPNNAKALKSLPKPSDVYLGGMFWDWRPSHYPYIGGGYCSALAGKPITIGEVLKKGNGKHMFFAGEATNHRPGATAHAALETGIRAAQQVAQALKEGK